MQAKAFRSISVLLGVSLLAVILLQAFWMLHLYKQELTEVDRLARQALNAAVEKLNERENLHIIKQRFNNTYTSRDNKKSRVIVTHSSTFQKSTKGPDAPVPPRVPGFKDSSSTQYSFISDDEDGFEVSMQWSDSASSFSAEHGKVSYSIPKAKAIAEKEKELNALVKKLETEIRVIQTSMISELKAEEALKVLKTELEKLGLNNSADCAIQYKKGDSLKLLSSTDGFQEGKEVYRNNLSQNRILQQNNFLLLQLKNKNTLLLSRMANMLVLSLLFTGLIVTVFFYTLNLVGKQKKISAMKNDFVNNITHELKTPIATIALATDAISNPAIRMDDEKFRQYTSILREENARLNDHVEKALQIAQMDMGKIQLHKSLINLKTLLESCVRSFALRIEKSEGQIQNLLPEQDVMYFGDEFHLRNAIINLLDNAIKYTQQKPRITLTLELLNEQITLRIKDKGIGIADSEQHKVFEKFYRVQGGDLHDVKGFGLGLSYVKSIVEAHGGTIDVQSERGKGSEFIIRLRKHD